MSYELLSEVGGRRARVHVSQLKRIGNDAEFHDAGDPQQGIWPDARRILRGIVEAR